jgi:hypothetical protein
MASEPLPLTDEDVALLERVAARVVELRMEVPAILALEGGSPLSVIAGQTMIFFEPFVTAMLRLPDYRRFARLVERRDVLGRLTGMIEDRADAAHEQRKAEKRARRQARGGGGTPAAPR